MQTNDYYSVPQILRRIAKLIGNILFYVIIIAIIILGIIGVVGRIKGAGTNSFGILGYNAYVVGSNSMYAVHPNNFRKDDIEALGNTQFKKGDLVIVRTLKDKDEIKDLDVVTFARDNTIIIHRVVDSYVDFGGDTFYTTQGDANNTTDGNRTRDLILGVMVANWGHGAGKLVSFVQSPWGITAVALALGICISAWLVYDGIKDKQKPREPDDLEEDAA